MNLYDMTAVDFFNQINMLYGTITEFCSKEECPVMTAGPRCVCLTFCSARPRVLGGASKNGEVACSTAIRCLRRGPDLNPGMLTRTGRLKTQIRVPLAGRRQLQETHKALCARCVALR